TSPVVSRVLAAGDVALVVKLKQLTPIGASKRPAAAEVAATLDDVQPPGPFYLRVSGTGIIAVGGSCQAQATGQPGPPGPPGPAGAPGAGGPAFSSVADGPWTSIPRVPATVAVRSLTLPAGAYAAFAKATIANVSTTAAGYASCYLWSPSAPADHAEA